MAVDYGDQRTGIAVSDLLNMICGDAWTVTEWNQEKIADIICEEAKKREVSTIVLGLPRNMDGSEGFRAQKSYELKARLEEKTETEVVLWDERCSSIEAHAILHSVGKKEKNHRKTVDAVAASIILEGYLQSL